MIRDDERTKGETVTWTQAICAACWEVREPGRVPVRVRGQAYAERCCDCGKATPDGIFMRIDPKTVRFPTEEDE